jgi:hypothetical protein
MTMTISGDLNVMIDTETMDDLTGPHGEVELNDNGEYLWEFCAFNKLRITNSFFRHKDVHKFTWGERGSKSIIDYTIANKKIWPYVTDTRVCRGAEVDIDHFLVLCKIRTPKLYSQKKIQKKVEERKFKVQLLQQESIRKLYTNGLKEQIKPRAGDVEIDWVNLREAVKQAACESLDTQKIRHRKRPKIWNEEIQNAVDEKKATYLKLLNLGMIKDRLEYKHKTVTEIAKRKLGNVH